MNRKALGKGIEALIPDFEEGRWVNGSADR